MQNAEILNSWRERQCVLATMHQKERVIAPLFATHLGMKVVVPTHFNTDRFGTFTREIARAGNQLEAARAKARAAMAETGTDLALASEGSFGVDPSIPFIPSNLELVLLIDARYNLEIAGHYRTSQVRAQGQRVASVDEAVAVATAWGFPQQGVIVRRAETSTRSIFKEITTTTELAAVSARLLARPFTKTIFLETDMRAHRCPARMDAIERATEDLIRNCQSCCPRCGTPGFVATEVEQGLPCAQCTMPTEQPTASLYHCQRCQYHERRPATETVADPSTCAWCNP